MSNETKVSLALIVFLIVWFSLMVWLVLDDTEQTCKAPNKVAYTTCLDLTKG